MSVHSSVQGESDSEPEGYISHMTSRLGSIFSSDSSDADVSDNEDTDDQVDIGLDKPVFLTSKGPVHMTDGSSLLLLDVKVGHWFNFGLFIFSVQFQYLMLMFG